MVTQQKYNEAEYFLEMMKENIENRQKFEYNIHAFTSAARSVTLVLQKEISKNPEFYDWYHKKRISMKRDELFNIFKNMRNCAIHEGRIDMRSTIEIEVTN